MKSEIKGLQLEISKKILNFLDSYLKDDINYSSQATWGFAFIYLSAINLGYKTNSHLIEKSLSNLHSQNINHKNYPWEFIVFALKEIRNKNLNKINHPASELRKKGTKVLNWQLLNLYNKLNFNKFNFVDKVFLYILIFFHQRKDGLLMDQINTRSIQYHNFSLFILLKIFEKDRSIKFLEKIIKKAIRLSKSLILSDGTANYIGRGQEQIFGYASLIGSLKIYSKIFDEDNSAELSKLLEKIKNFQKENGFIPLILRSNNVEKEIKDYKKNKPPGWYSYNSLLDYLPFLAYCLSI